MPALESTQQQRYYSVANTAIQRSCHSLLLLQRAMNVFPPRTLGWLKRHPSLNRRVVLLERRERVAAAALHIHWPLRNPLVHRHPTNIVTAAPDTAPRRGKTLPERSIVITSKPSPPPPNRSTYLPLPTHSISKASSRGEPTRTTPNPSFVHQADARTRKPHMGCPSSKSMH